MPHVHLGVPTNVASVSPAPSPTFFKCAWAQTLRDQNVPGNKMYIETTSIIALTKKAIPSVYFQHQIIFTDFLTRVLTACHIIKYLMFHSS